MMPHPVARGLGPKRPLTRPRGRPRGSARRSLAEVDRATPRRRGPCDRLRRSHPSPLREGGVERRAAPPYAGRRPDRRGATRRRRARWSGPRIRRAARERSRRGRDCSRSSLPSASRAARAERSSARRASKRARFERPPIRPRARSNSSAVMPWITMEKSTTPNVIVTMSCRYGKSTSKPQRHDYRERSA